MARTVRIGFIGAGGIANFQADRLKNVDGAKIVAACDVNEEALKKFGEQHGVSRLFKNYRQLVKIPELDAVSVCTPNYAHKAPTIAALRAGKHVLVEKPMAMNAREAQAMVDTARAEKRQLVIGFQHRFSPAAQVLSKAVTAGEFGKVLYVRAQALRRRGIPSWGVFGRKELQGGGPMIDIGVHIVETAHYIAGRPKPTAASGATYRYIGDKPPAAASPWGAWDHKTYTVEDLAVGLIRFDNGATLTIESSFAAHIEKDVFNVTVMGEKAGCTTEPVQVFKDEMGAMFTMTPAFVGNQDSFQHKMTHFVECVRHNKPSDAPGEDGLTVQKMLDGLYRSAELGREVKIR